MLTVGQVLCEGPGTRFFIWSSRTQCLCPRHYYLTLPYKGTGTQKGQVQVHMVNQHWNLQLIQAHVVFPLYCHWLGSQSGHSRGSTRACIRISPIKPRSWAVPNTCPLIERMTQTKLHILSVQSTKVLNATEYEWGCGFLLSPCINQHSPEKYPYLSICLGLF